jgi:hypothetical protein
MADDKKARFSTEVFGAEMARALDAFAELEVRISASTRYGRAAAAESVPFARPSGVSMYEADALTGRLYHTHTSYVVNAINDTAYGKGLARALFVGLFPFFPESNMEYPFLPVSVDVVRAALLALRRALHAIANEAK